MLMHRQPLLKVVNYQKS